MPLHDIGHGSRWPQSFPDSLVVREVAYPLQTLGTCYFFKHNLDVLLGGTSIWPHTRCKTPIGYSHEKVAQVSFSCLLPISNQRNSKPSMLNPNLFPFIFSVKTDANEEELT